MTLTSTVPAAVSALQAKMQAVAAANPALAPAVYVGEIIGDIVNNFLAIGDVTGAGEIVTAYASDFVDLEGASRSEAYGLTVQVRAWDEEVDPIARLGDAFTLMNGLAQELAADPSGSGALGSGMWTVGTVENPVAAKLDNRGFGVILHAVVVVSDVYIDS